MANSSSWSAKNIALAAVGVAISAGVLFTFAWAISKGWNKGND